MVGARFETEAEAGGDSPVAQFVRDIGDERLMLMSPTRFDDAMIRAYLDGRLGGHGFSDEQVDVVARFTRGLPLAVSLTATLLGQGQSVEDVCGEAGTGYPGSVVSGLARRYLVHAERREYPQGDPGATTWRRSSASRSRTVTCAATQTCCPRCGIPRTRSPPSRTWPAVTTLCCRCRGGCTRTSGTRSAPTCSTPTGVSAPGPPACGRSRWTLLNGRLEQMRARWPTLDEQVAHAGYTTALLAVLWHTLWTDNQAGLDLLARILPVLSVAAPAAAEAAAAMTGQFEPALDSDRALRP